MVFLCSAGDCSLPILRYLNGSTTMAVPLGVTGNEERRLHVSGVTWWAACCWQHQCRPGAAKQKQWKEKLVQTYFRDMLMEMKADGNSDED